MKSKKIKALLSLLLTLAVLTGNFALLPSLKADAASDTYYVKITWTCYERKGDAAGEGDYSENVYAGYSSINTGSNSNNCGGLSLFYKDANGTSSTEKEVYWDFGTKNLPCSSGAIKSTGGLWKEATFVAAANITGFPTRVFGIMDGQAALGSVKWKIDKIEIGASSTSTLTTLWSGSVGIDSTKNRYYFFIDSSGNITGKINGDKKTDTVNWATNTPVVNSISLSGDSEVKIPTSGAAVTKTYTATVTDQFGVNWTASNPTFSENSASSSITSSAKTATATFNNATLDYTSTVKASLSTKSASVAVKVKVPHTVTVDPNGGTYSGKTAATTYTKYTGDTQTVANPTRTGYDFDGWAITASAGTKSTISGTTLTVNNGNSTLKAIWTPNNSALAADDTFIDFGIKRYIDVVANDELLLEDYAYDDIQIIGVGDSSAYANASTTMPSGFSSSYKNLTVENNKLLYTPDTALDSSVRVCVLLKAGSKYVCSILTIVPASSVYYEDDADGFVTYTNGAGDAAWTTVGQSLLTSVVEDSGSGVPGFSDKYNEASNSSTYSMGSAHKVTVSANLDYYPTAEFTFSGTGFDVYSLTSSRTGIVLVDVIDSAGNTVKRYIVDTFCGFTKDENGDYVISQDNTTAFYQVPVVSVGGLAYDTYTVRLTPKYSAVFDHTGANSFDFYLDSVRIYNPINPSDDYASSQTSFSKMSVRDIVLSSSDSNAFLLNANGAVITREEYKDAGPKNELYLGAGQSVAFTLTGDGEASVFVSGHAPSGAAASILCRTSSVDSSVTFNSATELYHEISGITWSQSDSGYNSSQIVITNTGSTTVSLCNIVCVASSANTATYMTASMTKEQLPVAYSLMSRAPSLAEDRFYPEQLEADVSEQSVRAGESVLISVTTTSDVASLTVNSAEACSAENEDGTLTWTMSVTPDEAGELLLPIVSYNKDGIASETAYVKINVTERSAEVVEPEQPSQEDSSANEDSSEDAYEDSSEENQTQTDSSADNTGNSSDDGQPTVIEKFFTGLKNLISVIISFFSNLLTLR